MIVITDAYQAMRLVQGYSYETGIKPEIDLGAMLQGMCSESTAYPYLSRQYECQRALPPAREFSAAGHTADMAVGIPFEQFRRIVAGVMATSGTCK